MKTAVKRAKPARASTEGSAPRTATGKGRSELVIEGRRLPVSNLDKVPYPVAGFTKGQVIDYYIRIAPALLPHLRDRPLTLKRYPDGVNGGYFYEKRCPPYRPSWIKTARMWSEQHHADIHFCMASDLASLIWAANLADLELHTYLARSKNVDCPTMVVFDLDPGPPATVVQCAQVALLLKDALDRLKLVSYIKTSGSKGLQLYIPLNSRTDYDTTKTFARTLAEVLTQEHPDLVVSKMDRSLRTGKVLIDWSQNDRHKTTICVYSLRAKDHPTVSTPVTWDEVASAVKSHRPDRLRFTSDEVLKRVERIGDLFEPVLELKQNLPG